MKIKAVLFDFDGVLAKTMEQHFLAWKKALLDYGISIVEQDYYPLEGMKLSEVAETLFRRYGKSLPLYDEVVKKKINYYLENNQCEIYPGVYETLELLEKKSILMGIVSASVRPQLIRSVGSQFLERFDVIIYGDSTSRGKPFADPYLSAIERLRLSTNECVVVENAPLGIESANAAGIFCIALCSTNKRETLKHADIILDNFLALPQFFEQEI